MPSRFFHKRARSMLFFYGKRMMTVFIWSLSHMGSTYITSRSPKATMRRLDGDLRSHWSRRNFSHLALIIRIIWGVYILLEMICLLSMPLCVIAPQPDAREARWLRKKMIGKIWETILRVCSKLIPQRAGTQFTHWEEELWDAGEIRRQATETLQTGVVRWLLLDVGRGETSWHTLIILRWLIRTLWGVL